MLKNLRPSLPGVLAAGVMALGAAVVCAWIVGMDEVERLVPGLSRMRVNTGAGLFIGGLAVALLGYRRERKARLASRVLAALLLLLATATIFENMWPLDFGIDGLLMRAGSNIAWNGRMGRNSSICSVFAGLAILLLSSRSRKAAGVAQIFAVCILGVVLPPILAYSFGISTTESLLSTSQTSLYAALAFWTLAFALLAVRPTAGFVGVVTAQGSGGKLLLTQVFVLVPGLGWAILHVGRVSKWPLETTLATLTLCCLIGLVAVIIRYAYVARGFDKRRRAVENDRNVLLETIRRQNAELENSVAARTVELRQANDDLRRAAEEAQRLALVASRTTNAVLITDAAGRIEWANDGFTRITGYSLEEVAGRKPASFLDGPDTSPLARAQLRNAIWHGESCRTEILNYAKNGKPYWMRIGIEPVRGPDGKIEHFIGIHSEITVEVEQREALYASEARLRLANQAMNIGVWESLPGGRAVWDDGMLRLFGLSRAELESSPGIWKERIHPDDIEFVLSRSRALLHSGEQVDIRDDIQYRIVRPNGEVRTLRAGTVLLRSASGRRRMIGMNLDISEEHRIAAELRDSKEAAESANRAKSEFLALMSHEIRTPMNGVIGFTELLKTSPLERHQREWVETIRASSESLLMIINDILDFSKIESGHMDTHPRPAAVDRIASDVVALVLPQAREKGIEVHSRIAPEVPPWILTDGNRLRQILVNLAGNAVKFTDMGRVDISVSVESGEGDVPTISFSVQDTGPGIRPDQAQLLFEPFRQLDATAARSHGGTGLGLAISKRLCHLLGGEIEVAETSPAGTTFRFWLPLEECAAPAAAAALTPGRNLRTDADGDAPRQVLVAEDNLVNQRLISQLLRRAGYTPTMTSNGLECLASLRLANFALILLDCQMPQMDGFETTRRIRRGEAGLDAKSIPIIALTASVMEEDRLRCEAAGMDEFLSKPVNVDDLLAVLARFCRQPVTPA